MRTPSCSVEIMIEVSLFFTFSGFRVYISVFFIFNPYPGFLGPSPSVFSGKKSRFITGDVTVGTLKIKIICTDRVSVEHYYGANFKWHMPI